MTDFDFEILEAVAQYPAGIGQGELESQHFNGYELTYNLMELSRLDVWKAPNGVSVAIVNSACLYEQKIPAKDFREAYTTHYTITDRGKSLLANWQRRRAELSAEARERARLQRIEAIVIGVCTGVTATLICSKLFGL